MAPEPQPEPPARPKRVVQIEYANARGGPGTHSPIVGNVRRDMVVADVGRDGNWIQIEIPGNDKIEGWINSRMLKEQEPAATQ